MANNVTQAQAFCIATACLQVPVLTRIDYEHPLKSAANLFYEQLATATTNKLLAQNNNRQMNSMRQMMGFGLMKPTRVYNTIMGAQREQLLPQHRFKSLLSESDDADRIYEAEEEAFGGDKSRLLRMVVEDVVSPVVSMFVANSSALDASAQVGNVDCCKNQTTLSTSQQTNNSLLVQQQQQQQHQSPMSAEETRSIATTSSLVPPPASALSQIMYSKWANQPYHSREPSGLLWRPQVRLPFTFGMSQQQRQQLGSRLPTYQTSNGVNNQQHLQSAASQMASMMQSVTNGIAVKKAALFNLWQTLNPSMSRISTQSNLNNLLFNLNDRTTINSAPHFWRQKYLDSIIGAQQQKVIGVDGTQHAPGFFKRPSPLNSPLFSSNDSEQQQQQVVLE